MPPHKAEEELAPAWGTGHQEVGNGNLCRRATRVCVTFNDRCRVRLLGNVARGERAAGAPFHSPAKWQRQAMSKGNAVPQLLFDLEPGGNRRKMAITLAVFCKVGEAAWENTSHGSCLLSPTRKSCGLLSDSFS